MSKGSGKKKGGKKGTGQGQIPVISSILGGKV